MGPGPIKVRLLPPQTAPGDGPPSALFHFTFSPTGLVGCEYVYVEAASPEVPATCPALTGALRLTAKADWQRFRQGLSAIPPASLAGPELWTEVDVRE